MGAMLLPDPSYVLRRPDQGKKRTPANRTRRPTEAETDPDGIRQQSIAPMGRAYRRGGLP